jgi:hypothetical protein
MSVLNFVSIYKSFQDVLRCENNIVTIAYADDCITSLCLLFTSH